MSKNPMEDDENAFSRRTFMKASGAMAGASALGLGAAGSAAAEDFELDSRLLNWRTVEAQKVWDRGFRGRPDRTLALTDSGISARHPELGPFNGVTALIEDDGLRLIDPEASDRDITQIGDQIEEFRTGTAGPGTFVEGSEVTTEPFVPSTVVTEQLSESGDPVQLAAELHWSPYQDNTNDLELRLDIQGPDGSWSEVARAATAGMPETLSGVEIDPEATYRFVAEQYTNTNCDFRVTLSLFEVSGELKPADDPFAFLDDDSDEPMPKTVGWYDAGGRYGNFDRPRDPNGHGSHCAGIMTGTGRGSAIDYDNTEVDKPQAILLPGDFIEYEVDVHATSSVFVSALGENVKVEIVLDDEIVHESPLRLDSIIADEPAVHDSGTATYTVRVRPMETNAAAPAAQQAQNGNPTTGRLKEIAYGSYIPPAEVTEGARAEGGPQTVHPGLAPDMSLVGLQGLSGPTVDLGNHAEEFAKTFNIRAVNMSWGYAYGLPLGAFGGTLDETPASLKDIAQAGILPVAAAGNFMTPANGNSVPAGMDEPISVAATGPFDGLTPYSAGGVGTIDEDENDVDRKPDVTAPGGDIDDFLVLLGTGVAGTPYPVPSYYELVRSVSAASPDESFDANDPPRDYASLGGTSMASPYVCGVSGLVAQAMEEEAPDSIQLPTPEELANMDKGDALDWTYRLKQVILATASETAFTAAPYHAAKSPPHAPVYTHGGRDPYEGFGRANPDAAVDAVSRNLFGDDVFPELGDSDYDEEYRESVGTYIPEDSRAVAGYVTVPGGDFTASIEFDDYSGGNDGMAKGSPHLDLFVYDAENPSQNGEPNIVASDQGEQGSASVSVSVPRGSRDEPTERTFYVVAKIVNIPGVVNGYDVQANFDFNVGFSPAARFDDPVVDFTATGTRSDDGSVFLGGQTNEVNVTLESFNDDLTDEAELYDVIPSEWSLQTEYSDAVVDGETEDGRTRIQLVRKDNAGNVSDETVDSSDVSGDDTETFTYFVEAPASPGASGPYTFGPAEAVAVDPDAGENKEVGSESSTVGSEDQNVLIGQQT
ncbi:S8 family serine peptidase [Natronomonas halophila]|uniref:S8 family serine peptidase n=1 Tax=Natronomonas halophila TaxID=2747817 RepID=UPI0015B6D109|nr:S8 family serine peptidase [Natronomonas halophila]QLD84460.1 S8 family serine peptidase [Natronomonas halophila]